MKKPRKCTISYTYFLTVKQRNGKKDNTVIKEAELDTALLHLMLEHLGEGLCVLNRENRFIYVNPRGHEIFDMPRGYLTGKLLRDFLTKDQMLVVEEQEKLRQANQSSTYTLTVTSPKGLVRTLLVTGNPWFDEKGLLKGTFAVFRDITESSSNRKELAILKKAMETMHLGVTITDLSGLIIYSNPADVAMHGYEPGEVLGKPANLFGRGNNPFPITLSKLKEMTCWERESVNVRKDGSVFPVHLISDVVHDQEGNPMAIVTTCMDITEQKNAAKALHDKEEYLRGILESQLDLVTRTNLKGRFTYVNDAYCQTFGVNRKDVLHRIFVPQTHPDDEIKRRELQDFLFVQPYRVYYELRQFTVSGWRWIAWQGYSIHDENSNIIEIQSVGRDVTVQKNMEEELRLYATTDTLTGIFNRRTGILLLQKAIQKAKRDGSDLIVCFVDLDQLKRVNDQFGHQEGDNLIRSVCEILKKALRESDIIFRLGGDEFLLIFPSCTLQEAESIWLRIENERERVNSLPVRSYPVMFSHGFAQYPPQSEMTVDDLVALADQAMYQSKERHRSLKEKRQKNKLFDKMD